VLQTSRHAGRWLLGASVSTAFPWAAMLAVAGGASIGACLRWAAGIWFGDVWEGVPLGTLLVNAVGGLLMGVAMAVAFYGRWPSELPRLFVMTGFLGGLTTFSAFSAESLSLLQRGAWWFALLHTLAHVLGALACAAFGFWLARTLLRG
jgi:CrcB protein